MVLVEDLAGVARCRGCPRSPSTRAGRPATRGRCGSRRTRRRPAAASRAARARARPAFCASSGRPASSIRSRSSLTSACCSSPSPSSSWIAFSCWRRKYSRWPLSISDSTWDWILEPSWTTSSSRVRISERRRSRLVDVDLLEQLLLLLGRDPQGAGDQVGERRGLVDVGDGELQLLGQVGDLLDDLAEGALDVAGQRLELGRWLEHVGHRLDPRDQVGLLGDVVEDPDPLAALDQDAQRAVGDLHHPGDGAGDADVVEVVRARARRARGPCEATIASIRLPERTSLTSLIERSCPTASGVSVSGIGDRLPQRQDRAARRAAARARRDCLLDVGDLDDLELGSLDVGHRQCALPRRGRPLLGALDRDLAGGLRQPRVGSSTRRIPSS